MNKEEKLIVYYTDRYLNSCPKCKSLISMKLHGNLFIRDEIGGKKRDGIFLGFCPKDLVLFVTSFE